MKKSVLENLEHKNDLEPKSNRKNQKGILKALILFGAVILLFGLMIILFGQDILKLLKDLFMLKYLPKLGNNASYGLIFVFGVFTSFHCVGMCGGIALSQTLGNKIENASTGQRMNRMLLVPSALYNLGRVISYTIVGGIVGGLGQVINFTGMWRSIVPIIGGSFMIIMAVNLLGVFPVLRRFNLRMPSFIAKKLLAGNNYGPLVVGLLSGLMPCGPLQMAQLYALGTRSILYGAASMLIFSLGTVPALFLFGFMNTYMNKKHSKLILRISALLVLSLGFVMLGRGLALAGIELPDFMNMHNDSISSNIAYIDGNRQIVDSSLTSDSFPAITVQKGIPVKWNIHADKNNLNDCNNALVIPKLKIEKKLEIGDNTITFQPEESGTISFTCWMGMIKSRIYVVDDLAKVDGNKSIKVKSKYELAKTGRIEAGKLADFPDRTFEGWIIDSDCIGVNPETHSNECNKMKTCIESGEGILVNDPDTGYSNFKFILFDEESQKAAVELIMNSKKDHNVTIKVTGKYDGKLIHIKSIKEFDFDISAAFSSRSN